MADTAGTTAPTRKSVFAALELDMRLLGMIGAFVVLAVAFNVLTDGRFLTPRNIFNLTIQTVSVAIMATGMVFVIVTRHIDLSVGSLLATCSAVMAMLQTVVLPGWLGLDLGSPLIAPLAILVGLACGTLIGAFHGWLVGYLTIPAFIVTLGGLLVWRNVAWYLTSGQTIGPLDETFQLFGGINGTLGATGSWIARHRGVLAAIDRPVAGAAGQARARLPGQADLGRGRWWRVFVAAAILGLRLDPEHLRGAATACSSGTSRRAGEDDARGLHPRLRHAPLGPAADRGGGRDDRGRAARPGSAATSSPPAATPTRPSCRASTRAADGEGLRADGRALRACRRWSPRPA